MLNEGDIAPGFSLPDKDGRLVKLSDFQGKRVVLYFYPRDNTPGCSKQACAFRDAFQEISKQGAVIIGISKDSQKSHQNFASKYELPFLLLSDPEREAIESYGVWQLKKLYGKESMGVVRTTFVIDTDGKIEKIYKKVKPDTNAIQVLSYLKGES